MSMIINIKNKKAIGILKSLEEINFIEISEQDNANSLNPRDHQDSHEEAFFDLQGIWKNRNMDIDTIRNRAWNRK